jgi:prophage tail gpP-like protein
MLSQTNASSSAATTEKPIIIDLKLSGDEIDSEEEADDTSLKQPTVQEETYTTATSIDDEVRNTRVYYFVSDTTLQDQQSRQDRVDWEKNIRKANGFSYTLTIQGFRNSKKQIWRPNMLVTVNDKSNDVYADLLVLSVQFNMGLDSGTHTRLTLTTPEAFKVKTEKKTKADKKSKKIAEKYQKPIIVSL